MRLSLRQPMWVLIGLLQPILYLTLFGPLLQNIAATSGFQGDAWQVFVPGLLVQLGIFGGLFVGFGIIAEWRAGRHRPADGDARRRGRRSSPAGRCAMWW